MDNEGNDIDESQSLAASSDFILGAAGLDALKKEEQIREDEEIEEEL